MRQLYSEGAFAPIPVNNGFVFIAQQPDEAPAKEEKPLSPFAAADNAAVGDDATADEPEPERMKVGYKICRLDNNSVNPVTRSVYLLAKFGINYDNYQEDFKKYLLCRFITLSPKSQLVIEPNGDAKIVNSADEMSWVGVMCFNGEAPCCVYYDGRWLWATFNRSGAVIKYDSESMHDELRIGGGKLKGFDSPEGIWADNRRVLVCSGCRIVSLDLESFEISDYRVFDEPVHNYLLINGNEIVQLDSGFYAL